MKRHDTFFKDRNFGEFELETETGRRMTRTLAGDCYVLKHIDFIFKNPLRTSSASRPGYDRSH